MSYWDGDRWTAEGAGPKRSGGRRANWAATAVMVLGAVALLLPFAATSAASQKNGPNLTVGCGTACVIGGSLTVNGSGFTPSAGGQQVILWVEYPNDYCGTLGCHGFYFNPWVNPDGTFTASIDNAVLQAGTGGVEAIQYNARSDKWAKVSYTDYATQ